MTPITHEIMNEAVLQAGRALFSAVETLPEHKTCDYYKVLKDVFNNILYKGEPTDQFLVAFKEPELMSDYFVAFATSLIQIIEGFAQRIYGDDLNKKRTFIRELILSFIVDGDNNE